MLRLRLFKAITRNEYPSVVLGKPSKDTFDFAKGVVEKRVGRGDLNIYMVGDNIESDIKGANAAGWRTILVRTGVYDPSDQSSRTAALRRAHKPGHEVEDVFEAVEAGVREHMMS